MGATYRAVGIVLLLGAALVVCVGYATADRWSYPDDADVAETPDAYDGEQLLVFRPVESIDRANGTLTVLLDSWRVEVRPASGSLPASLEPGADVQVSGTLAENSTVLLADRIVVDFRGSGDWLYVIATSLLGVGLAAGQFLRHWGINWREGRFEPRGDG